MSKTENNSDKNTGKSLGIYAALIFYILSIIMIISGKLDNSLDNSDVKVINFAHWQLEDGFREGYEKAIEEFKILKAKNGIKVEVVQTTVPFRGYPQWFLTQLIGGNPADVIELRGSSELRNQYFVPLSQYIGDPNPFNKGTRFEGVPWKDTYIDGMDAALDTTFGEYFGVGTFTGLIRVYVNMDLLHKATGSNELPETLEQWLAVCEKMSQYGRKAGIPIIPIGVRGFDKVTLNLLFGYYLGQMNCHLNENLSGLCQPIALRYEIMETLQKDDAASERLYAVADILKNIGNYFGEGFTATDKEQTKFLFFSGNVGFYPEGSWDAYSMVNNSPFDVKIMQIPVIDKEGRYGKYFHGRPSEQGQGVGGQFGIPKSCKNFDLALEFLQFITSWKINQMVMVDYSKWPPAVKDTKYKGILASFKPVTGSGMKNIQNPFMTSEGKSKNKILEALEDIIINQPKDAKKVFRKNFINNIPCMINETEEAIISSQRALFSIEGQRSSIAVAKLLTQLKREEKERLEFRVGINSEFVVSRLNKMDECDKQLKVLKKLRSESN